MAKSDLDVRIKLGIESKEYRAALRRANVEAKEFKKQQKDAFKAAGDGATSNFGKIITMAKKVAPAVAAGLAAAIKVANDAIKENQTLTDEWARVTESAKATYAGFINALASGNFSGYLSSMDEIIARAREAADALDALGTAQIFTDKAMTEYELAIRKARLVIKDPTSSIEQRREAGETIKWAQEQQLARTRELANYNLEAFAAQLARQLASRNMPYRAANFIEKDEAGNYRIRRGSDFEKFYGDLASYNKWNAIYLREKALRATTFTSIEPDESGRMRKTTKHAGRMSDFEFERLQAFMELSDENLKESFDLYKQGLQAMSRVLTSQTENFEYLNKAFGGGATTTITSKKEQPREGSIAYIDQQISDWGKKMSMETSDAGRAAAQAMIDELKAQKNQMIADANAGAIETLPTTGLNYSLGPVSTMPTDIQGIGGVTKESKKFKLTSDEVEKGMTELNTVFSQTSSIIGALSNKSMKANQVIGTIMSAIGSIIGGPWGAALRGVGSIVGAFDTGGIVGGTSYKGDRLTTNVSSGEMILNRMQQRNLFNALQGGGAPAIATTVGVRGEDVYIALNNYMRRTNKSI